jgi:hypothetical protein
MERLGGQLTVRAITHAAEFLVLSKYFRWPRGLADLGEKVPKPEGVANFMDKCIELLFPVLSKHLRIQNQLMTTGIASRAVKASLGATPALQGIACA